MIVTGIALFVYNDKNKKPEGDLTYLGNILIGISLLMDGLKGAAQDVMRNVKRPSSMNFMLYENGWSTLLLLIILLINNEGIEFIEFSMRHTVVWYYLGFVMLCSIIGQFFISSMITNFGSLPCILTTTLRKFFTVLFSVFFFDHHLMTRQWIATAIIFTALTLDVFFGRKEMFRNEIQRDDKSDVEEAEECDNLKDKKTRKNWFKMKNNKVAPE